jgi:manganese/zinc/iron transport system substrate-binding protein
LAAAALASGCKRQEHSADNPAAVSRGGPLHVVCTIGMLTDAARNVGGPHVNVDGLMGEGVDPHLYKASPHDVRLLSDADMILYNGLGLEGKMSDLFVKMARSKPTYAVADAVPEELRREPPEFAGHYDPHVWFDVSLWIRCVARVGEALGEVDAAHRDEYAGRARSYIAQLKELDGYVREQIATIPKQRRVLVTAHDAFGYFGRAYDIDVRAIQGISTESEASVKNINDLVSFIVERGVKAVFVESSVSKKNIQALVEGCAARGHSVTIGGELFSDAMGRAGTPEGTYVGMVRHNVDTIVRALK